MYKAVLFDLDDTLHDDTRAFTRAANDVACGAGPMYGINEDDLAAAFLDELEVFWRRFSLEEVRRIPNVRMAMWARALERFDVRDDDLARDCAVRFEEARKAEYALFAGIDEMLSDLRRDKAVLALVSNGMVATHREKIEILQLSNRFDAIFLSDEVGFAKPSPEMFYKVCRTLNVSPAECIMVGDRFDKDIVGALDVGMAAIWMNRLNRTAPSSHRGRYMIVRSIEEMHRNLNELLKSGASSSNSRRNVIGSTHSGGKMTE